MFKSGLRHDCTWFSNLLENAGEKGFSIAPVAEAGETGFALEARPFDRGVLHSVKPASLTGRIGIGIELRVLIQHCPSCGLHLPTLIASNRAEFDELIAARNRQWPPV